MGATHPPFTDVIRRARQRELALGWMRFLRFIELQKRLDAGEPIIRIERP